MIDRRTFLGSTLGGLGLGIEDGVAGSQRVKPLPVNPIPATHSGFEEYEQALASSNGLEALGIPPSWSFVREGFHPLTPERIVIVPPDAADPYCYRDWSGSPPGGTVLIRTTNCCSSCGSWTCSPATTACPAIWRSGRTRSRSERPSARRASVITSDCSTSSKPPEPSSSETIPWTGGSSCSRAASTTGRAWTSSRSTPCSVTCFRSGRFVYRVLALAAQTARAIAQASSWVEVSRMDRISAARFVNRRAAEALAKVHW